VAQTARLEVVFELAHREVLVVRAALVWVLWLLLGRAKVPAVAKAVAEVGGALATASPLLSVLLLRQPDNAFRDTSIINER
jgi:hypothetical protein